MPRFEVRRDEKFPFLTMRKVLEDREPTGDVVEMSGDDFADYEEAANKFAAWQHRLSEVAG